jgi:hypothetical protein
VFLALPSVLSSRRESFIHKLTNKGDNGFTHHLVCQFLPLQCLHFHNTIDEVKAALAAEGAMVFRSMAELPGLLGL